MATEAFPRNLYQAALAYGAAGIPVFPLVGTQPLEKAGGSNIDGVVIQKGQGGFHQATTDHAKIERWWAKYPDANIGAPTGQHTDPISGQRNRLPFDVLDVDPGRRGEQSLSKLEAAYGPL